MDENREAAFDINSPWLIRPCLPTPGVLSRPPLPNRRPLVVDVVVALYGPSRAGRALEALSRLSA